MGRKKGLSGQHRIDEAEQLFAQSVALREPDYRLVALAIGASPAYPPPWAIEACISLYDEEHSRTAAAEPDIAKALDEMVRIFDGHFAHWEHVRSPLYEGDPADARALPAEYKGPPLRWVILEACQRLEIRTNRAGGADDNWIADIRRAWTAEQADDAIPSYLKLGDWKVTRRIERVVSGQGADECGHRKDWSKALWLLALADRQRD